MAAGNRPAALDKKGAGPETGPPAQDEKGAGPETGPAPGVKRCRLGGGKRAASNPNRCCQTAMARSGRTWIGAAARSAAGRRRRTP